MSVTKTNEIPKRRMPKSAFPTYHENGGLDDIGCTMRDYMAARAMQAMLSMSSEGASYDLNLIADDAYAMANEMMRARKDTKFQGD